MYLAKEKKKRSSQNTEKVKPIPVLQKVRLHCSLTELHTCLSI